VFTPVIVSLRPVSVATTSPFVADVVEYITVAVGCILSPVTMFPVILATVAVLLPVLPARSLKVNVKLPFPVNVCVYVFTHVIVSLRPVNVAITFPVVVHVVEYTTLAVGAIMSPVKSPVPFTNSSALFIISITYHLISKSLGVLMFCMIPTLLRAFK
jgi:hypothetical protein